MNKFIQKFDREKAVYLAWILDDNRFSDSKTSTKRKIGDLVKEKLNKNNVNVESQLNKLAVNTHDCICFNKQKSFIDDYVRHIRNCIVHDRMEEYVLNDKTYIVLKDVSRRQLTAYYSIPEELLFATLKEIAKQFQ